MKQPKKLTFEQKRMLSKKGYDCREWMVVADNNEELVLINKSNGSQLTLYKS